MLWLSFLIRFLAESGVIVGKFRPAEDVYNRIKVIGNEENQTRANHFYSGIPICL